MTYSGPMQYHLMDKVALKGFRSWDKQRSRCNNPNHGGYKNYGGKGIKVHYSARDFVGWWIENFKTFKGDSATVGRIDHDDDYRFDNIIIQSRSDNSKEVYPRNKKLNQPKKVNCFKNGVFYKSYTSGNKAALDTGYCQQLISSICLGKRGATEKGFSFTFEGVK